MFPVMMAAGSLVKHLITSNASDDAMDQLSSGFSDAQKLIQDSTAKSFQYLEPYLKGGQQDYNDYRQLSKSGYYDTPAPISYQPQAYQNQGVAPTGFNPGTMSFGNSYQPMQFQPMGLLSSLALPPTNLPPSQPAATPQAPSPQAPASQFTPNIQAVIRAASQVRQPNAPQIPNNPMSPVQQYNPQTGQNSPISDLKPIDPRMPTIQDLMKMIAQRPWTKGGSGPYGLMGPGMMAQRGGLA
jgi:hypothetical protein